MDVHTQYRPGTTLIDIWLTRDTPQGRMQHVVVGEDTWEDRRLEAGLKTPKPSLTLEDDVFRALIASGSDILPPSAATERHLADAIKVRDRLLDQVAPEKGNA
jgi:hypothetical protein